MMKKVLLLLFFGIFQFDVSLSSRFQKESLARKVLVKEVPLGTVVDDVDKDFQFDRSAVRLINNHGNKRERPRNKLNKGKKEITQQQRPDLKPMFGTDFDPGGDNAYTNRRRPKNRFWNSIKERFENKGTNSVNGEGIGTSNDSNNSINGEIQVQKKSNSESHVVPPMAGTFIVGGVHAVPRQWSWQASIQYFAEDRAWHHFCGGSLIHSGWVVTAAHCVTKLEHHMVRVVLGEYQLTRTSNNEQVINPSRILMHGYYEPTTLYYDIAMVKLEHSPTLNSYVSIVTMATLDIPLSSQNSCYITGWGKTIGTSTVMSDTLEESPMTIITRNQCRKSYRDVIDTQICAESASASVCTGDSGSPLVCLDNNSWVLAGLASWVGNEFCEPTSPNVFTRIPSYEQWAQSVIANY